MVKMGFKKIAGVQIFSAFRIILFYSSGSTDLIDLWRAIVILGSIFHIMG
jgi:hypothetical protein